MSSNEIKKIIYSMLKEILEGDSVPTEKDYDITKEQFLEIVELMKNEGLINPKKVSFYIGGDIDILKSLSTVTMKGIEFLEENNKWNKLYKGIKEFRNFLPM